MTTASVSQRLADTPTVRDRILAAAQAARGRAQGAEQAYAFTHSWVFTGAPGSGRAQAVIAFAAALECTNPDEVGCGHCDACRAVFAGAHPDVVHVVPTELSISVAYVREEIIAKAYSLPVLGHWRVVLVENADRLTVEASNALLKTVEEPPSRTVLVFCAPSTDPEDFSITLNSRCRHVYVPQPSIEELVRILVEEEHASPEDARLAAHASMRHIGRARHLVKTPAMQRRRAQALNLAELVGHRDQAFAGMSALLSMIRAEVKETYEAEDAAEVAKLEAALGAGAQGRGTAAANREIAGQVKALESTLKKRTTRRLRDRFDLALVDLAGLYRDALVLAIGARVAPVHPDFGPLAQELADEVGEAGLVQCLDAVELCRQQVEWNVPMGTAGDALIGRLRQVYAG